MGKFTGINGKPVMRSTKEQERKKALKITEQWEESARKAKRGELTQAASHQVLRNLLEISSGEKLSTATVNETLSEYVNSRSKLGMARSTTIRYKIIMFQFIRALGETRANGRIGSLTVRDIEHWRDSEIQAGKTAKTVNMGLSIIRAALNTARRRGDILVNPAEAVERVSGRSEEREPFTNMDLELLYDEANADWRTAILFGVWTGLRLADIVSLRWEQIDFDHEVLIVITRKTNRKVAIALSTELSSHLRSFRNVDGIGPIMPSLNNRASGSNGALGGLSNEFGRLMKRAGVDAVRRKIKSGKGRRFSGKSFHSLRHTFVTRCALAGAGESITKSMTGHSSESAFRRYVHLGVDAQRTVFERIPKITDSIFDPNRDASREKEASPETDPT